MEQIRLDKKWEVLLIHHSHTDIGYTQSQETIELYHVNFIKQAIEICELLRENGKEGEFIWTCESFWGVECFLKDTDDSWKTRFEQCIKNGGIEITANYLNFNELIDYDVLKNQTMKAIEYCNNIGINVKSAMTADINGYGEGYADALYDCGVRNLLSCVHTHHGMYPLFKKQTPFYWETKKGNKVLVWNGEHYHFGNEFGIVNTATGSYINKDELGATFTRDKLKEYGKIRMFRYLKGLEKQGYEYDFVPITVHGLPTDNGSPNIEVLEFINWWNENFKEEIEVKAVTLDEFFKRVEDSEAEIPTYKGDWPDWWAFGVGSTPNVNKVYKEAQRLLRTTKLIDEDLVLSDKNLIRRCEDMLALYAEHTWGHSSSITNPWNSFVNLLDYKKASYAVNAHESAIRNYNNVLEKKGMSSLKPNREPKFKVINPYDTKVTECVKLSLDYWETSELKEVIVDNLGNEFVTQSEAHPRGKYINFIITLEPKEERTLIVKRVLNDEYFIKIKDEKMCCQGIEDIYVYDDKSEIKKYNSVYENNHVKIEWDDNKGIISWFDKINKIELIDSNSKTGAFMPVYEITKADGQTTDAQYRVRQVLGRNMRGKNGKVYYPNINSVEVVEMGDVFGKIHLRLDLEGTSLMEVVIKIYNDITRADVNIIVNKDSVWDPESLYVTLPFALNNEKMDLLCEKTGCVIQAKKDQLPGTNCDFYLVQDGVVLKEGNFGVSIAMPDSSLIYTSELKYENSKKLFSEKYTAAKDYELYSWTMNNIWETNFKASLGGFIEFNYYMNWCNDNKSVDSLIDSNKHMNTGFVNYRID